MNKIAKLGVKVASFGIAALVGVAGCTAESGPDVESHEASAEEANVGTTSQAWEILDTTTCNNLFGSDTAAKYKAQKKAMQLLNYFRGSQVWPTSPYAGQTNCTAAKTMVDDLRKFVAKDVGGGWAKAFTSNDTTVCSLPAAMTRICKRRSSCGGATSLWPGQTTASDSADLAQPNSYRTLIGQCFGPQIQAYFFPVQAYWYNADNCAVCLDVDPGPVKLTQNLATNGAAAGTYLDGNPVEDANQDGATDTVLNWPAAYTAGVTGKTWGGRPCSTVTLSSGQTTDQVLVRETSETGAYTGNYSCRAAAGDELGE